MRGGVARDPSEFSLRAPPQAAEPHADREVGVSGASGGVDQMKPQRRGDDGGELGGLAPGPRLIGQPPRVGLAPEDAIDQECQGPGLEQVEADAEEQQTQAQGYPSSVGPEVTQRPEQLTETPDGVHRGNLRSSKPHATRPRRNRTANASQLADF